MENLNIGLMMAFIGMGVVMVFLVFMMGVMRLTDVIMEKLGKIFPEEVPQQTQPQKTSTGISDEIAVAIATMLKHKNLIKGGK